MLRFYMLLETPEYPKKPVTVSGKKKQKTIYSNVEEQYEFLQNTWVFLRACLKKLKTKSINRTLLLFIF